MAVGYKKIFWGIFIATFNITIGMLPILPAFVGWLVVVTGLSELERSTQSGAFLSPKKGAIALVSVSLGGLLLFLVGYDSGSFLPLLFYPLFLIIIEFVVFHKILEGAVRNFKIMYHLEAVERYTNKDRTYIMLMGITMVLLAISLTFNHEATGSIAAVMAIISRLYLMITVNALKKEDYKIEVRV